MSEKYKIIISSLMLSVIAAILYLAFRADSIENEYTVNITKIYAGINSSYLKIEPEISKANENSSLREFFEKTVKSYPEISLIASADESGSIILASKNDKYIKTAELFDLLLNDFSGKKFTNERNKKFSVKYYEQGPEKKREQIKFYIYTLYGTRSSLLVVFPYDPDFNLILKVSLEILLVIALSIMLIAAFHILTRKKKNQALEDDSEKTEVAGIKDNTEKTEITDKADIADKIDNPEEKPIPEINISKPVIAEEPHDSLPVNITSSASYDALNQHVFDLFKTIYKKYLPLSISLHLKNTSNTLNKAYELRGKSFLKIESSNYDPVEISGSLADELKKTSCIIMDSGKKIMVPVINDNSIIGILAVVSDMPFSSSIVNEIKDNLKIIVKPLSEFISISSGMIDRETGLYSRTYFNIRLSELLSAKKSEDKNFSLMIIKIFNSKETPDSKNISTAFKLLAPAIIDHLPSGSQLFSHGEYIAVLALSMENDLSSIAETLCKTLARYRIKISKDNHLPVYPGYSITSSASMENPALMLETALKKINEE